MEINKKEFNKWIKALRSGKYKQAKGQFQKEDGYCCLGVACRVINKTDLNTPLKGITSYESYPDTPEWLNNINKDFRTKTLFTLWELNDSTFATRQLGFNSLNFNEIADCLELVYIHEMPDFGEK